MEQKKSASMMEITQFKDEDLEDEIAEWHAENAEMSLVSRKLYHYNPAFLRARLAEQRQQRIREAPFQGALPIGGQY